MKNIVVIGGGLMGASAAWKLAERGEQVTLLEQQSKDYLVGSSHGTARISRSLGGKKDVFSYVHNQTVKEVVKLIDFLRINDPKAGHSIDDVYSTSPVSYLYHRDQYEEIKKLRFKKQKNDFSLASQRSSFRKFGMTIPDNTILVREKRQYSGILNPQALIKKLRTGIEKKGGTTKYQCKVVKLVKKVDYFELSILNTKNKQKKTLKARQVIVATGPYLVETLKNFAPYFNRIITPKKVALSFLKITDKRYKKLSSTEKEALHNAFPLFSQIGKEYFSMITTAKKGTSPIFKVGGHQRRRNIHDLDKVWTESPPKKERKWMKKQFRKQLKMLEIQLSKKDIEEVDSYHCVYSESRTNTPLVTPIFDRYGSLERNLVIIGGMSGIGAKGCLCYGSLAADLILGKTGKANKMYRKMSHTFGNPSVNLYTRRRKPGRLF